MMIGLFFLILLIIAAQATLTFAEVDALSATGQNVESAAMATSNLIGVFKSSFAFFSMGVMAMIGATRTHSKDEDEQADADHKTGKIFQVALLGSLLCSGISIGLSFALFDTYLGKVMDVADADIETVRPYLNYVAPTILLYFPNQIMNGLCLQTGGISVVVADILLDNVLGLSLFLTWARNANGTDELIKRVALVNVILPCLKFAIYAIYITKQAKRFQLLDTSAPKDLPYKKIGMDLVWQWLTSMCAVCQAQMPYILLAQLGKIKFLGLLAITGATSLTAIPGNVCAWYMVFFGSRYVGDKRYAQFWGLYRAMTFGVVMVCVLAVLVIPGMIKSQVKIVSSDANLAEVSAYVETIQVGVIALGASILQMFMVFISYCFVAWTQFERQFYCYLVGLVCAAPVYGIAYLDDNFTMMMLGNAIWYGASLMALATVWYWRILPEALSPETKYGDAEQDDYETIRLLAKEEALAELQDEIEHLAEVRERRYLMLSETIGWTTATLTRRRTSPHEMPADYDSTDRRHTTPAVELKGILV